MVHFVHILEQLNGNFRCALRLQNIIIVSWNFCTSVIHLIWTPTTSVNLYANFLRKGFLVACGEVNCNIYFFTSSKLYGIFSWENGILSACCTCPFWRNLIHFCAFELRGKVPIEAASHQEWEGHKSPISISNITAININIWWNKYFDSRDTIYDSMIIIKWPYKSWCYILVNLMTSMLTHQCPTSFDFFTLTP